MALVTRSFSDIITFTRASSATYFNSAGVLTTAANNVPRLDYNPATLAPRGLLIEEQRVNSIRNNTMQGAVAGTPGTAPTNWATWTTSANGMTPSIVAVGSENGISYIDWRYQGTYSGATGTAVTPSFEGTFVIAATVGQAWTESVFISLVSGSLSGVTLNLRQQEVDSGGLSLVTGDSTALSPVVGSLSSQKTSYTRTNTNASCAFIVPRFRVGLTNGQTYDFTLRIGLPQLELGAFATSVIPTTTAAATRSADVASVNTLSPWFNATEGTLFLEWSCPSAVSFTGNREAANLSDNTYNNIVSLGHTAGGNVLGQLYTAGVANIYEATAPNLTVNKAGVAYITNSKVYVANGTVKQSNTSAGVPTLTQLGIGNPSNNGALKLCGWVRRVSYYPSRLSNAQLQALTA